MHHEVQAGRLADRREIVDDVLRTVPEAQPVVKRHHEQPVGPGFPGHLGVLDAVADALAREPRDDGHASADGVYDDSRHLGALTRREREYLARVAVGDESVHPLESGQPPGEAAKFGLVDIHVVQHGNLHRGQDSRIASAFHHVVLSFLTFQPPGPAASKTGISAPER